MINQRETSWNSPKSNVQESDNTSFDVHFAECQLWTKPTGLIWGVVS